MFRVLFYTILTGTAMFASEFQVGLATRVINPSEPIFLSGYAGRKHPSEGVLLDIKAKAMVIRHKGGAQAAIVTMDLIGIPRGVADVVSARVEKQYGIERARLLLNASHTHTAPLVGSNLQNLFDLQPEYRKVVDAYAKTLGDTLVNLVGAAIGDLQPAAISYGTGQAHFAINRRQMTPKGVIIGLNPDGPTDPTVPVLKVTSPDGKVRALLFGYSCHNTTLTAEFYTVSGDYAGYAQAGVEQAHPGATAMFMQLCGGDQNPNPRSKLELAQQHGRTLAEEVNRVAAGPMESVTGPIRAAFQTVDLAFAHHTRSTFEAEAKSDNEWRARNARHMLKAYDEGRPVRTYPYPVQAIALGKDVTFVALGGEVVIDYCLRIKREYGARGMIVAGYSNDVMAYIPSARVLKEGGYEANDSMVYYGQPGPWADDVEERIMKTVRQVAKRVGRKAVR